MNYSTFFDIAILVAVVADIAINTIVHRRMKRLEKTLQDARTSQVDPTVF